MREFIITVNSTVDLPKEWLEERHVPVLPLKYTIDGETYTDMSGLTAKEFFQKLREGHMSVTSQINPEEAREMLEPFVKEGKDVLHLGFSSGLSGTCNSMRIAAEELAEDYPEAKIIVIYTLCACLGEASGIRPRPAGGGCRRCACPGSGLRRDGAQPHHCRRCPH